MFGTRIRLPYCLKDSILKDDGRHTRSDVNDLSRLMWRISNVLNVVLVSFLHIDLHAYPRGVG